MSNHSQNPNPDHIFPNPFRIEGTIGSAAAPIINDELQPMDEFPPIAEDVNLDDRTGKYPSLRALALCLEQYRAHNFYITRTVAFSRIMEDMRQLSSSFATMKGRPRELAQATVQNLFDMALDRSTEEGNSSFQRAEDLGIGPDFISGILLDAEQSEVFIQYLIENRERILGAASLLHQEQDRQRREARLGAIHATPPMSGIRLSSSFTPVPSPIYAEPSRIAPALKDEYELSLHRGFLVRALGMEEVKKYLKDGCLYPMAEVLRSAHPSYPEGSIVMFFLGRPHLPDDTYLVKEDEIAGVVHRLEDLKAFKEAKEKESKDLHDITFDPK